jgi:hypothetical protein
MPPCSLLGSAMPPLRISGSLLPPGAQSFDHCGKIRAFDLIELNADHLPSSNSNSFARVTRFRITTAPPAFTP